MAVQFNLLPDVKLEFNRAQHLKRVVYGLSILVTGIAVVLFILSFLTVNVLQKKLLSDANNDIQNYSQKIKSIPDLDKVLTIQNQLNSLPGLHNQKHISSRLFSYLPQVTPANVHIGQITLDLNAGTLSVNGTADSVATVNTFVDTLKFTNYVVGTDQANKKLAFTEVVLSSIGRSSKGASYTLNSNIDPALFDGTQDVKLVVPNEVTTRSVLNSPGINNLLFNGDSGKPADQQGGQ